MRCHVDVGKGIALNSAERKKSRINAVAKAYVITLPIRPTLINYEFRGDYEALLANLLSGSPIELTANKVNTFFMATNSSWHWIYAKLGEVICRTRGISKDKDLVNFEENVDFFRSKDDLLVFVEDQLMAHGHDTTVLMNHAQLVADAANEVDSDSEEESNSEDLRNEIQDIELKKRMEESAMNKRKVRLSSFPSSSASPMVSNDNSPGDDDSDIPPPSCNPSSTPTPESLVMDLITAYEADPNPQTFIKVKLYPLLIEVGWKRVNGMAKEQIYLAPWAAKSCAEGGAILESGKCDVKSSESSFVLDRDYFLDFKKILSFLSKNGCARVVDAPLRFHRKRKASISLSCSVVPSDSNGYDFGDDRVVEGRGSREADMADATTVKEKRQLTSPATRCKAEVFTSPVVSNDNSPVDEEQDGSPFSLSSPEPAPEVSVMEMIRTYEAEVNPGYYLFGRIWPTLKELDGRRCGT